MSSTITWIGKGSAFHSRRTPEAFTLESTTSTISRWRRLPRNAARWSGFAWAISGASTGGRSGRPLVRPASNESCAIVRAQRFLVGSRHAFLAGRSLAVFDQRLEAFESRVPLLGDLVEVPSGNLQLFVLQLPDRLPPAATRVEQAGSFHDAQVLGDRLPRHLRSRSQLCDRHRPLVAKTGDQPKSSLIAKRCEDRRRAFQFRGTTAHARDTWR